MAVNRGQAAGEAFAKLLRKREKPPGPDFRKEYYDLSPEGVYKEFYGRNVDAALARVPKFNGNNSEEIFQAIRAIRENAPSLKEIATQIRSEREALLSKQAHAHTEEQHTSQITHTETHSSHSIEEVEQHHSIEVGPLPEDHELTSEYAERFDALLSDAEQRLSSPNVEGHEDLSDKAAERHIAKLEAAYEVIRQADELMESVVKPAERFFLERRRLEMTEESSHEHVQDDVHSAPEHAPEAHDVHEETHDEHETHDSHAHESTHEHTASAHERDPKLESKLLTEKGLLMTKLCYLNRTERYNAKVRTAKELKDKGEDNKEIPKILYRIKEINRELLDLQFPSGAHAHADHAEEAGHEESAHHEGESEEEGSVLEQRRGALSAEEEFRRRLAQLDNALQVETFAPENISEELQYMGEDVTNEHILRKLQELRAEGLSIPDDLDEFMHGTASSQEIEEVQDRLDDHAEEVLDRRAEFELQGSSMENEMELRTHIYNLMNEGRFGFHNDWQPLTQSFARLFNRLGGGNRDKVAQLFYTEMLNAARTFLPEDETFTDEDVRQFATLMTDRTDMNSAFNSGNPERILKNLIRTMSRTMETRDMKNAVKNEDFPAGVAKEFKKRFGKFKGYI